MADTTRAGLCCGHDHVGGDELWLTTDELIDLIQDTLDTLIALPATAGRDERRAAIRSRFDESRAARKAKPPEPAATGWRERMWG